jgi:hypothetical protein
MCLLNYFVRFIRNDIRVNTICCAQDGSQKFRLDNILQSEYRIATLRWCR